MGRKFEMRVTLYENDALGMATKCNGANGAEIIAVLCEIVNAVAENIYPDETEQYRFIYDLVTAILKIKEEDRT